MSRSQVLADLRAKIGHELHVGEWHRVTQEMIDQFAQLTGDQQWIHTDVERARSESPYGTTIAHGYLTLSLIPALVTGGNSPQSNTPGVRLTVNYGLNKVRFPHPVPAGSCLRARTTLVSVEPVQDDAIQMVRKVVVEIEGIEKPACVAETVLRYYF